MCFYYYEAPTRLGMAMHGNAVIALDQTHCMPTPNFQPGGAGLHRSQRKARKARKASEPLRVKLSGAI